MQNNLKMADAYTTIVQVRIYIQSFEELWNFEFVIKKTQNLLSETVNS